MPKTWFLLVGCLVASVVAMDSGETPKQQAFLATSVAATALVGLTISKQFYDKYNGKCPLRPCCSNSTKYNSVQSLKRHVWGNHPDSLKEEDKNSAAAWIQHRATKKRVWGIQVAQAKKAKRLAESQTPAFMRQLLNHVTPWLKLADIKSGQASEMEQECESYGCRIKMFGFLTQKRVVGDPGEDQTTTHHCFACMEKDNGSIESVGSGTAWAAVLRIPPEDGPPIPPDTPEPKVQEIKFSTDAQRAVVITTEWATFMTTLASKTNWHENRKSAAKKKGCPAYAVPLGKPHVTMAGNYNFTPDPGTGSPFAQQMVHLATLHVPSMDLPIPSDVPTPVNQNTNGTLILATPDVGITLGHFDPGPGFNLAISGRAQAAAAWVYADAQCIPLEDMVALIVADQAPKEIAEFLKVTDFQQFQVAVKTRLAYLRGAVSAEYRTHIHMIWQHPNPIGGKDNAVTVYPGTWHTVWTFGPMFKVAQDFCTKDMVAPMILAGRKRRDIIQKLAARKEAMACVGWTNEKDGDYVCIDWYLTTIIKQLASEGQ